MYSYRHKFETALIKGNLSRPLLHAAEFSVAVDLVATVATSAGLALTYLEGRGTQIHKFVAGEKIKIENSGHAESRGYDRPILGETDHDEGGNSRKSNLM